MMRYKLANQYPDQSGYILAPANTEAPASSHGAG